MSQRRFRTPEVPGRDLPILSTEPEASSEITLTHLLALARRRMKEAAALADYFVVLAPHSNENDRIVNAEVLAAMKPGAYLVNVSRGGVVDEDALIQDNVAGRSIVPYPLLKYAAIATAFTP